LTNTWEKNTSYKKCKSVSCFSWFHCFWVFFFDVYKTWVWIGVEFGDRVWSQWRKKGRREVMAPVVRSFPGVGEELQRILEANMDEVPARKRAREAFKNIQLGIDHILFKVIAL
jgi:hypothetical protein